MTNFQSKMSPDIVELKANGDVDGLIALICHQNNDVRKQAVEALRSIGDERAIRPLKQNLNDKDSSVRAKTVLALGEVLGRTGSTKYIGTILDLIVNDNEKGVRKEAFKALVIIGPPATEKLLKYFATYNSNRGHTKCVLQALGNIGGINVANALLDEMTNPKNLYPSYGCSDNEMNRMVFSAFQNTTNSICHYSNSHLFDALILRMTKIVPYKINGLSIGGHYDRNYSIVNEIIKDALIDMKKCAKHNIITSLCTNLNNNQTIPHYFDLVVELFDNFEWIPNEGASEVFYWVAKMDSQKCAQIGMPAVNPLIKCLYHHSHSIRKTAAKSLVMIYNEGKMDEKTKQSILLLEELFNEPHIDTTSEYISNCSPEFDQYKHTDTGIGLNNPLQI